MDLCTMTVTFGSTETSYLLRPDGSMVSGWYYYDYDPTDDSWDGSWQYRNQNGTKYDGWLLDGGQWYYILDSYMVNNTAFSPGIYEESGDETAWIFDAAGHLVYGGWYWHNYPKAKADIGYLQMPTVPDITDGSGKTITGTTSIMAT